MHSTTRTLPTPTPNSVRRRLARSPVFTPERQHESSNLGCIWRSEANRGYRTDIGETNRVTKTDVASSCHCQPGSKSLRAGGNGSAGPYWSDGQDFNPVG